MPRNTLWRPAIPRTLVRLRQEGRLERDLAQQQRRARIEERAGAIAQQHRRDRDRAHVWSRLGAQRGREREQIVLGGEDRVTLDRDRGSVLSRRPHRLDDGVLETPRERVANAPAPEHLGAARQRRTRARGGAGGKLVVELRAVRERLQSGEEIA